uniref:Uncharacterized protein n=1 Tax=Panagrolaimus sp. ES5 TaxID=591445 RepID=A0AC34F645_9BILA
MFNMTINHRKHYRDKYSITLKKLEESDSELKAAKKMNEVLKKQNAEDTKRTDKIFNEDKIKEAQLFEAEEALSKLKKQLKDVQEEFEGSKNAMISIFKNDMDELEEKREENERLRRENFNAVKEKNAQIEINQLLNDKLKELQNEMADAQKQIAENDKQKISLKKFIENIKAVNDETEAKAAAHNAKIRELEEEIQQLKNKHEADTAVIEEWTNKAMIHYASLREQEEFITKLKSEIIEAKTALQNQIEQTAAKQKEINLLKNEIEVQQEGKCDIQILPNRKRPNILTKNQKSPKSPKQPKKTVNQESHQPSRSSPPTIFQQQPLQQQNIQQQPLQALRQMLNQNNVLIQPQQNMPCQTNIQQFQNRQPFQQLQNIPSGYSGYPQQQQGQIPPQIPQQQNTYPNFQQSNAQNTIQFQNYLSNVYQNIATYPGFSNFNF